MDVFIEVAAVSSLTLGFICLWCWSLIKAKNEHSHLAPGE